MWMDWLERREQRNFFIDSGERDMRPVKKTKASKELVSAPNVRRANGRLIMQGGDAMTNYYSVRSLSICLGANFLPNKALRV